MIRLHHVTRTFAGNGSPVNAVSDITLDIAEGSLVLITGENGAGKTTLLCLMSGLLWPTSGRVFIDGRDLSMLPERFITRLRRKQIGMVFQDRFLLPDASVFQNLVLPLLPENISFKEIKKKADAALSEFGLKGMAEKECRRLSGGEKQRLLIARALLNDPAVILADEPATYLDETARAILTEQLQIRHESGKTIVIVTHGKDLPVTGIQPRRIRLERGRLMEIPS